MFVHDAQHHKNTNSQIQANVQQCKHTIAQIQTNSQMHKGARQIKLSGFFFAKRVPPSFCFAELRGNPHPHPPYWKIAEIFLT